MAITKTHYFTEIEVDTLSNIDEIERKVNCATTAIDALCLKAPDGSAITLTANNLGELLVDGVPVTMQP